MTARLGFGLKTRALDVKRGKELLFTGEARLHVACPDPDMSGMARRCATEDTRQGSQVSWPDCSGAAKNTMGNSLAAARIVKADNCIKVLAPF